MSKCFTKANFKYNQPEWIQLQGSFGKNLKCSGTYWKLFRVLTHLVMKSYLLNGKPLAFDNWTQLADAVITRASTDLRYVFENAPSSITPLPRVGLIFTVQSWNDTLVDVFIPQRIVIAANTVLSVENTPYIFAQRPVDID